MTLFERDESAGGLVRFGVPDFKIEKTLVQRRVEQLLAEGVQLRCGVDVGSDVSAQELRESFDAVVLATGSRVARELQVPGRELDGVHPAMDYLYQRNRFVAREHGPEPTVAQPPIAAEISAAGKDVVVIGGGDTGADCVGNALREGARSIVQLELLPRPPAHRPDDRTPWPLWPTKFRLSYAMEEATTEGVGEQDYSVATTSFLDDGHGAVCALRIGACSRAAAIRCAARQRTRAARAAGAARDGLPPGPSRSCSSSSASSATSAATSRAHEPYTSSVPGVFAAGDARRGQSLIVWAINEGRQCARVVERYLAALDDGSRAGKASPAGAGEDGALAGHSDADAGPEGPPEHVSPGIGAGG